MRHLQGEIKAKASFHFHTHVFRVKRKIGTTEDFYCVIGSMYFFFCYIICFQPKPSISFKLRMFPSVNRRTNLTKRLTPKLSLSFEMTQTESGALDPATTELIPTDLFNKLNYSQTPVLLRWKSVKWNETETCISVIRVSIINKN